MDRLADLEILPPARKRSNARYLASIRDQGTKQEIVFTGRERLRSFNLERAKWSPGEKHCDGVVAGTVDGESVVCFVELKGTHDEKAMEQLASAVDHFHPAGRTGDPRSHGDDHHDRWAAGDDAWAHMPPATHQVVGIAISFHRVVRDPPSFRSLGGKRVGLVAVQVARERNQAVVAFDRFLRDNGLL